MANNIGSHVELTKYQLNLVDCPCKTEINKWNVFHGSVYHDKCTIFLNDLTLTHMVQMTKNTLNLVGDGDDLDILYGIEDAFDVTIEDAEAQQLLTLGDLHQLLSKKLNADSGRHSICTTAISFYRLRRALANITGQRNIRPSTPLSKMLDRKKYGSMAPQIEQQTGLKLPAPTSGTMAFLAFLILFFGPLLFPFAGYWFGTWGLSVFLGWPLLYLLCRFPAQEDPGYCTDIGGLAAAMAALNYASLAKQYNQYHKDDVWAALTEVIKDQTGIVRPVDKKTTFFAATA